MPTPDPRIDAYIDEAPEFARPILRHLRSIIHRGCPHAVETIKWGSPFFDYNGLLCGLAAFKAHCGLIFWRDVAPAVPKSDAANEGMGQLGKIRSMADLPPPKTLLEYVRRAVALRDAGKPARPRKATLAIAKSAHGGRPATAKTRTSSERSPRKSAPRADSAAVPADLQAALDGHAAAARAFHAFPPSHRREYVEWIVDAKRPETRAARIAKTVTQLGGGHGDSGERRSRAR